MLAILRRLAGLTLLLATGAALAAAPAPDVLIRQVSTEVLETARNDKAIQAGDVARVAALVENKVMPHVDFEVVTRSAVGPQWRSASAEQRSRLQAEFKQLLIRVYAGALTELRDQTVQITRTQPVQGSTQVIVQSEVRGKGEPVKLDYRLDKRGTAGAEAWKIIDVNVAGLWLVQNYRTQFAQELSKGGIDGLIAALVERNKGGKG
ncbi:MAG: phospholipid-binding protein MlaC [Betaproteobacteria bacterium]|nr:ABC transporter substrate-binding protein [Burkholderiaceae bacterium]MCZ8112881.1 ABC transporter substrate-binding protein [Rubrivivax sp.]MCZ8174023.1 ABC transporter substrate-binding protein [Burkholderiaceae bacterium]